MIGRRSHDDAQSFDDALAGRTPDDRHIAELVRVAETLCEAAALQPEPTFRQSLRAQLMTEAQTVLVPMKPERRPAPAAARPAQAGPVRRRVATVTAAVVASAGVVGLVASSASAVPGEMLYPVKRGVESAELALHRDDASRGRFQLDQASERLAEARTLSAQGESSTVIAETLDDFAASATRGSGRLFTDFSSSGQQASIQRVNEFAATSSVDLAELSARLPESLGDSFEAASNAVTDLAGEAATLCATCDPADVDALLSLPDLTTQTPAATKPESTDEAGRSADPVTSPRASDPARPSAPAAAPKAPRSGSAPSTASPPAAPPTTSPPTSPLAPLTDPLLGGLLGDEDQVGLVPGLVNGLLGTTPKP